MPTLRQITCGIELGPGNIRLKEYGHTVTDGAVEAYIVAPEVDNITFHVRITSDGYIAPGLSAYVFMDGEYQCNRNRLRLRFPEDGVSADEYQIDFKLRQKEEKTSDGTFIARDWCFTPLGTGIADKAPNMKNFTDNVGTIEVVILRCKDGGGEELATDPAQTIVSRNPSYAVRAPSVRVPSSRPQSHAPSVHPPSARAASGGKSQGGSSIGGMFGIFDGTGDDPGYYKQYRPRNIVGQEHLPGHRWDAVTGQYRYFNDQDPFVNGREAGSRYGNSFTADRYRPQTYTVGGGFSEQESVAPQEQRPEGPKVFIPPSSPGYDFSARRRKLPSVDSDQAPKSTYDFTRLRKQEVEKPRQESARPQQTLEQPGSGFAFIENQSFRLRAMIDGFHFEAKKYAALKEDAERYHDRKNIYSEILKASHLKHDELLGIMKSVDEFYEVLKEVMNAMDRATWRRASDFLYEKGLYPPPVLQVQPPPGQEEEKETKAPPTLVGGKQNSTPEWEQVGGGTAGDGRQRSRRPSSRGGAVANTKTTSRGFWDVSKPGEEKDGDTTWGNVVANNEKSSNSWANSSVKNSVAISDKKSKVSSLKWNKTEDDGWANDDKGGSGGDKWENNNNDSKPAPGWEDDNKPRSKSAKPKDSRGGGAEKEARRESRHEDSSKSRHTGAINDGAASDYHTLGDQQPKPVIKPYWSEWTKKPVMVKPKVQPREVYEYPALPLPVLPSGKADNGITQAVHAGKGANYAHKLHRPEYLDTMSKPYAIFTFKYRSKAALEAILKHKIDDSNINEAKAELKKHQLLSKSKDELIEEVMKKTSIAAQSKAPFRAATNKNDDWGAPVGKAASPKRTSSHRRNSGWDKQTEVKPSDSVSQHSSKSKALPGWDDESQTKPASANGGWANTGGKNEGNNSWEKNEKSGSKKESNNSWKADSPASNHASKKSATRSGGGGTTADWAAEWDSKVKSAKKSTHTVEHFAGDALPMKKARGKEKAPFAGW